MNVIFLKLRPQQGDILTLSEDEKTVITKAAQEYAEALWNVCQSNGFVSAKAGGAWEAPRHFRSVFSMAGDCKLLRDGLLAKLEAGQPHQRAATINGAPPGAPGTT